MARLEITDTQGRRTVELSQDRFTIGRRNSNDLQLNGMDISRNHAEINRHGESFSIRDLGSRYGTFVNGEAIQDRPLVHGDRIRFGPSDHVRIVFQLDDSHVSQTLSTLTSTLSTSGGDFRAVAALLKGLRALGSGNALDEVLGMVLEASLDLTGAERAFIMLAGEKGGLEFKMGCTRDGALLPGEQFHASKQIPEKTFATGETQEVADMMDAEFAKDHQGTIQYGIRGAICVPLRLVPFREESDVEVPRPRLIGVLYLDRKGRGQLLSNTARSSLETLATEATVAIENARLYRDSMEKVRLEQELHFAAKMQQALLPPRQISYDSYEAAGSTTPCRAIGGDFLDYFPMPDGRLGLILGDVSGKGPPAAILAATVHGMLSAQAEADDSPASIMRRVNQALVRRNLPGRFATVFFGILSPDGMFTFCNAGHNFPILIRRDGSFLHLETGGIPIGILEDENYEEETIQLEPVETLVIYSDGISEAERKGGEQFGEDRLQASLASAGSLEAEPLLDHIHDAVDDFVAGHPQADDITVLILRFFGADSAVKSE